jgi:hypothetical protein
LSQAIHAASLPSAKHRAAFLGPRRSDQRFDVGDGEHSRVGPPLALLPAVLDTHVSALSLGR